MAFSPCQRPYFYCLKKAEKGQIWLLDTEGRKRPLEGPRIKSQGRARIFLFSASHHLCQGHLLLRTFSWQLLQWKKGRSRQDVATWPSTMGRWSWKKVRADFILTNLNTWSFKGNQASMTLKQNLLAMIWPEGGNKIAEDMNVMNWRTWSFH